MRSSKAAQLVNDQTVQRKRSGAAASVTITFQKKTDIQANMENAESETEVRFPAHETNGIAKLYVYSTFSARSNAMCSIGLSAKQ